jgi:hypothetical protein
MIARPISISIVATEPRPPRLLDRVRQASSKIGTVQELVEHPRREHDDDLHPRVKPKGLQPASPRPLRVV